MIPIIDDGNCLFHAISHCLYGAENKHIEIRSVDVGNITKKWRTYENFSIIFDIRKFLQQTKKQRIEG